MSGPSPLRHITFDALQPYALARFWASVTGFELHEDDSPEDSEVLIEHRDSALPGLLFQRVTHAKNTKNRLRLDLMPPSGTQEEEIARLQDLGASIVADHRQGDGSGFIVLADPEGNEFCVERSAPERSLTGPA